MDEDIQEDNLPFMFNGTPLATDQSMSRKESLLNRKEHVINILNESYKDETLKGKDSNAILKEPDDLINFDDSDTHEKEGQLQGFSKSFMNKQK